MAHAQTNRGRTIWIRPQCLLIKGQCATIVFFIERNARFTQQRRYVRWRLIQHEIELSIGLFHFVTFQQTKVCTAQQVILIVHDNFVGCGIQMRCFHEQFALFVLGFFTIRLLYIICGKHIVRAHLIFFIVAIVCVRLGSGRFQNFYEIVCLVLLIISQLQNNNQSEQQILLMHMAIWQFSMPLAFIVIFIFISTYRNINPCVYLWVLLPQNTQNFLAVRQLVWIELDNFICIPKRDFYRAGAHVARLYSNNRQRYGFFTTSPVECRRIHNCLTSFTSLFTINNVHLRIISIYLTNK